MIFLKRVLYAKPPLPLFTWMCSPVPLSVIACGGKGRIYKTSVSSPTKRDRSVKSTPPSWLACGCLNTHTQIFHLLILSSPDNQLHMASDYTLVTYHVSCSVSEALVNTGRISNHTVAVKSKVLDLYSDADWTDGRSWNGVWEVFLPSLCKKEVENYELWRNVDVSNKTSNFNHDHSFSGDLPTFLRKITL